MIEHRLYTWDDLWELMRLEPHQWIPTNKTMFDAMRDCVPPIMYNNNQFLVGECNHHNAEGKGVYAAFVITRKGVQAKYMTIDDFKSYIQGDANEYPSI